MKKRRGTQERLVLPDPPGGLEDPVLKTRRRRRPLAWESNPRTTALRSSAFPMNYDGGCYLTTRQTTHPYKTTVSAELQHPCPLPRVVHPREPGPASTSGLGLGAPRSVAGQRSGAFHLCSSPHCHEKRRCATRFVFIVSYPTHWGFCTAPPLRVSGGNTALQWQSALLGLPLAHAPRSQLRKNH